VIRLFAAEECCPLCDDEQLPLTFDEIHKKKYTDGVIYSDEWWELLRDVLRNILEDEDAEGGM